MFTLDKTIVLAGIAADRKLARNITLLLHETFTGLHDLEEAFPESAGAAPAFYLAKYDRPLRLEGAMLNVILVTPDDVVQLHDTVLTVRIPPLAPIRAGALRERLEAFNTL